MKNLWIVLISVMAFASCDKQLDYVQGEMIVAFEPSVTNTEAISAMESNLGLTIKEWITDEPDEKLVLVNVPEGEEESCVEIAETLPDVKYAQLNKIVTID